jgi:pimeloyl-ACP methyl ester carboxylesterase
MISGYSTASNMNVPYVVLGDDTPSVLVIPGIEPEHRVPEGLRLQGVRGAFETMAEQQSLAVAWRADREPDELTLEAIADDYVDLIRELEIADVAIVGISTGAPFAIETAARIGPRCRLLALISGGASLSAEGRTLTERAMALAEAGNWRGLARSQIAAHYPDIAGRTLLAGVAWLFPQLYGAPEDPGFFLALNNLLLDHDMRDRAQDVTAPSLVINGERDVLYPPSVATETALLITNGEAVTIPRAGHGAFKSHAGRINRILLPRIAEALG